MVSQAYPPRIYARSVFHAVKKFAEAKACQKQKSLQQARTVPLPIPGRQLMGLLNDLPQESLKIGLGKGILTVTLQDPSLLSFDGHKVDHFELRGGGFGAVTLHGPFVFKWEMIVSEEGFGPVEGNLSMTVGGWTAADRSGNDAIKQCFDPQLLKKRRPVQPPASASGKQRDKSVQGGAQDNDNGCVLKKKKEGAIPGKENTSPFNSDGPLAAAAAGGAGLSDKDSMGVKSDRSDEKNCVAAEEGVNLGPMSCSFSGAQPAAQPQPGPQDQQRTLTGSAADASAIDE